MIFRPRLMPAVVAAVLIAIGVSAGQWQSGRARYKLDLRERIETAQAAPPAPITDAPIDAEALRWRPVVASGVWEGRDTLYLDNRVMNGVPGYQVITPLKIGATRVLVNRGWVAAPRSRQQLPAIVTPEGEVTIIGQARIPLKNAFALGPTQSADGRVWQRLDINAISAAIARPLAPIVVFQNNDSGDGLVRQWDAPDYGIATHQGYALQWYSLAVLSFVFFLVMSFKRPDGKQPDEK